MSALTTEYVCDIDAYVVNVPEGVEMLKQHGWACDYTIVNLIPGTYVIGMTTVDGRKVDAVKDAYWFSGRIPAIVSYVAPSMMRDYSVGDKTEYHWQTYSYYVAGPSYHRQLQNEDRRESVAGALSASGYSRPDREYVLAGDFWWRDY